MLENTMHAVVENFSQATQIHTKGRNGLNYFILCAPRSRVWKCIVFHNFCSIQSFNYDFHCEFQRVISSIQKFSWNPWKFRCQFGKNDALKNNENNFSTRNTFWKNNEKQHELATSFDIIALASVFISLPFTIIDVFRLTLSLFEPPWVWQREKKREQKMYHKWIRTSHIGSISKSWWTRKSRFIYQYELFTEIQFQTVHDFTFLFMWKTKSNELCFRLLFMWFKRKLQPLMWIFLFWCFDIRYLTLWLCSQDENLQIIDNHNCLFYFIRLFFFHLNSHFSNQI